MPVLTCVGNEGVKASEYVAVKSCAGSKSESGVKVREYVAVNECPVNSGTGVNGALRIGNPIPDNLFICGIFKFLVETGFKPVST